MASSNDLFEKIERNQRNLLERIEELDRQISEVLREWSNPSATEAARLAEEATVEKKE